MLPSTSAVVSLVFTQFAYPEVRVSGKRRWGNRERMRWVVLDVEAARLDRLDWMDGEREWCGERT